MTPLEAARADIDRIDSEMAALFLQRMEAVQRIAACKQESDLPVRDPAREQQVIEAGKRRLPSALHPYYTPFAAAVMAASRQYQTALTGRPASAVFAPLDRVGQVWGLARRVLIVTDDGVPAAYADTVAAACKHPCRIVLPAGEQSKSVETLHRLHQTMLDAGFTRRDCVVAVGGGVVSDVAGLSAATYFRGIPFYAVPTTTLAQADAALGGKTAVNFGGVKNAVGVFYPAAGLLLDPALTETETQQAVACGLAETVKMALTLDADLFDKLERDPFGDRAAVLRRSLALKAAVTAQDPQEADRRRILNFGHTVGHGIESVTGLPHGMCVAAGMLPFCAPAVKERLVPLLQKMGLPTRIPCDKEAVFAAVTHDKKRTAADFTVVTVPAAGSAVIQTLTAAAIRQRIEEVTQ